MRVGYRPGYGHTADEDGLTELVVSKSTHGRTDADTPGERHGTPGDALNHFLLQDSFNPALIPQDRVIQQRLSSC